VEDIFEDFGGCAVIGIVVVILRLLICVAIVVFGVALSDIIGS
jgi:hypothetical protein